MKKSLIIKLNDILVDISVNQERAIRKSIEFFTGSALNTEEFKGAYANKECSNEEFILQLLGRKNIFIRESAVSKKYQEYYAGKELKGFISEASLLIEKKKIDELSEKFNLKIISLMPKYYSEFIIANLGLDKYNIITADSCLDAIKMCKGELKGNICYLGNCIEDYEAAKANNLEFVGFNITDDRIKDAKIIRKIEEFN